MDIDVGRVVQAVAQRLDMSELVKVGALPLAG
jgi:hypothetical protein